MTQKIAVKKGEILIIEDKSSMAEMLKTTLTEEGFYCSIASDGEKGIKMFSKNIPDLVLVDLKLPKKDGIEVLKAIQSEDPTVPVIIMTAYGTVESAVEAMKLGAYDFITKPFDIDHLIVLINKAIEKRNLYRENLLLKQEIAEISGIPKILGKSFKIKNVIEKVKKVASTKTTVLLLGESGTGKELLARAIHFLSPRRDALFVPINCAAIPKELLESEFFGYEKGAFTGATSRKIGKFEIANKGTIFLDEIAELDLSLQAKLLRVLQEQVIERIGGTRSIQIDIRIIAATNANITQKVSEGKFREDLYYRLNVFPIEIPPLRERKEDIPILAEYFINKYSKEMKIPKKILTPEVMEILIKYNWKGNVRELENTIERAMILADKEEIKPEHITLLNLKKQSSDDEIIPMNGSLEETAKAALKYAESKRIKKALIDNQWNKTRAAEELKISYKTLLTKIKEYRIN